MAVLTNPCRKRGVRVHAWATYGALVRTSGYPWMRSAVGTTPSVYARAGVGVPRSALGGRGRAAAHPNDFAVG